MIIITFYLLAVYAKINLNQEVEMVHRRKTLLLVVVLSLVLMFSTGNKAHGNGVTGTTERISVASDGTQANGSSGLTENSRVSISNDGRYVVFQSYATNLVPGNPTGGSLSVYMHDRITGANTLIAVQGRDGTISGDGRYVAYTLDNGTPSVGGPGVFVYDTQTGITNRVDVAANGGSPNSGGDLPSISNNGRYVVFQSYASNLVASDSNGKADVFVRDLVNNTTTRVSVASDGTQSDNYSGQSSISADGRYIVFSSDSDNLVPNDTNGQPDVFIHDMSNGITQMVSVSSEGLQGNAGSGGTTAVSEDGRYVVFGSLASNLVPNDDNNTSDVFVRDQVLNTTRMVNPLGNNSGYGGSEPSISADGKYIGFLYNGPIVTDDGSPAHGNDLFIQNTQTGGYESMGITSSGTAQNSGDILGQISTTGEFAIFESTSTNLVPDDTNGVEDVFIRDRGTQDTTPPTITDASFSTNPKSIGQTIDTLTAQVSDDLSGVSSAEYFDPIQQTWSPMTISGSTASANVNFNDLTYPAGMYIFEVRATDNAGNVSAPTNVYLDVYDTAAGYAAGHGFVTPNGSTSNPGDYLPPETGQNVTATFDFTVKYLDSSSTTPTGSSIFTWGSNCNKKTNTCFSMNTDSLNWLIVQSSNSTATFQGLATLTQSGSSLGSNYPVTVTTFAGGATNTPSHYLLQVYQVGSNPNMATPIYQASGDLTGGQIEIHQ